MESFRLSVSGAIRMLFKGVVAGWLSNGGKEMLKIMYRDKRRKRTRACEHNMTLTVIVRAFEHNHGL